MIREIIKKRYLILDGAMGTLIAEKGAAKLEAAGSCAELLNEIEPDLIAEIHAEYLAAGADILKSNSFGALPWVLEEFGIAERAEELAAAAVKIAKECCAKFSTPEKPRFVAASLGPGTKLPSLGHINFDEMAAGYRSAARGAINAGAEIILLETCQDPLQIKAAIAGINNAKRETGASAEIMVSATIESAGAMLIGTDAQTLAAILSPYDLLSIGLNCGVGPDLAARHIKTLAENSQKNISIHANAGLPQNIGGKTLYPMGASEFADLTAEIAANNGVCFAGGCCGTTPAHIKALADRLNSQTPRANTNAKRHFLTSLFNATPIAKTPCLLVGERANATGSKAFRDLLLSEDYEKALAVANEQIASGADALDLSVGFAGRDEIYDMTILAGKFALAAPLPLMIDSTKPEAIEAGLKKFGGRAIINSANLEDGEAKFNAVARIAKKHGAALLCLAIDESGMAKSAAKKLEIAERMRNLAIAAGLDEGDLVFDLLTFTIASGDEEYRFSARETLSAIASLREKYKKVGASLGVSNVSFGLKGYSRELLNSVFLRQAIDRGLTMAIVNTRSIVPPEKIALKDLAMCERLLSGEENALFEFIAHFEGKNPLAETTAIAANESEEDQIVNFLISGQKEALIAKVLAAKERIAPEKIVNELLIGAMKEIGERFGDGRMRLPFVLRGAEAMKAAVDSLAPFLPRKEGAKRLKIVIGTVKGDVHDVGKNLVDILLSNNGFDVVNIGIKTSYEEFARRAAEHSADAIGMSGLLVKSTQIMAENLAQMQADGLKIPVLLGGAALNKNFVAEFCQPLYDAPVVYCRDAFDAINALNELASGTLKKTSLIAKKNAAIGASRNCEVDSQSPAVADARVSNKNVSPSAQETSGRDLPPELDFFDLKKPNFYGRRVLQIAPEETFDRLNLNLLFKTRWGFAARDKRQYETTLKNEIEPIFNRLKTKLIGEKLLTPVVIAGIFPAKRRSGSEIVEIYDENVVNLIAELKFPRSRKEDRRSIADYFSANEIDAAGFLFASSGTRLDTYAKELNAERKYEDYHFVSALSGELAESGAIIAHEFLSKEMAGGKGVRYAPGYPACPDLALNKQIFDLLRPDEFGAALSESFLMSPQASTCAIFCRHPEARYFAI
ncbi:MAG: homocysteine S-methyltransferase family protein [Helicobacteraceae bacterium]|jgi:5-methyltetrahydrofolate--homocysteine methyltransferase|nr:homocysteine S-methyltransferase family protein [Helicobacteraceae bacterium]